MTPLPIDEAIPRLLESLSTHPAVVLHAPPGAGKTTRVPLALLDVLPATAGRIIMLEPRRIAAAAAAQWMAACLGEKVGQTIGYSIRFDSCTSAATRIEVVTEGILTRRIQQDPALEGVAVVIFDEFHERSIHADLGLLLCRDVQQLRPELKILVMSATLEVQPLVRLLDDAPLISSAGRSYPVTVVYCDDSGHERLERKVAAVVPRALRETPGDLLVFLPGIAEIRRCAALLAEMEQVRSVDLHQLYGELPVSEQQRIIQRGRGRKIVLATAIAETSLTIDGVTAVIDSGVSRRLQYDPGSGLNRLVTVRESKAAAVQRAGRAGRTAPGSCYRLFSLHTFSALAEHTPAEITVTELSPLLLELAAWGVGEPLKLSWLDDPPAAALETAAAVLRELGLFDHAGRITASGRAVVRLPLHPRLGRLLLRSQQLGCVNLGCALAALISERDLLRSTAPTALVSGESDIEERLDVLEQWLRNGRGASGVEDGAVRNCERVMRQLSRLMNAGDARLLRDGEWNNIACLLLAAYPDRVARRRPGGGYLLANGRGARLSERSVVRSAEYLVAVALDGGSSVEAVIHQAAQLTVELIREVCDRSITRKTSLYWDEREGRVIAQRLELLGAVQLSAETVVPTAAEATPVVIAALRESSLSLLTQSEALRQLQGRMRLVRAAFPADEWPDYSDATLAATLEEWLAPHLDGITTAKKIARLEISEILLHGLDYRRQRLLDELTPLHLQVPSGSRIRVDYSGEAPVLAVKLQELFGLADGPVVCNGRVPLLLHLLSPAGRPLQVTRDLKGFWDGSYQQVKKEMKGRYPKHPWPDDPWSAVPTRRLKGKAAG